MKFSPEHVASVLEHLLPYQPVTLADIGDASKAKFCIAIYVDEPVDLYYISQFICLNNLSMGTPVYKPEGKAVYFPELIVDGCCYDMVVSHGRSN